MKVIEPVSIKVPRNASTNHLYSLENRLHDSLKECAYEWLRVFNIREAEIWSQGIPQAMFDLLDSFTSECSVAAAKSYLRGQGFHVS